MRKSKIVIGAVIIAAAMAACAVFWCFTRMLTTDYSDYYTRADNNRVREIEDEDFHYEYRLQAFDEDGESKEYIFMTADKLEKGAFLHLYTLPFRGVVKWEYIEEGRLPSAVKEVYTD